MKIKQSRKLNIEKIIMVFENVIFKLWKSLDIQNRKLFGVKIVTWWRTMSSMGLLLTEGRLSFLLSLLKTKELFDDSYSMTHMMKRVTWFEQKTGTYTCIAKNIHGTERRVIDLNVYLPPQIKANQVWFEMRFYHLFDEKRKHRTNVGNAYYHRVWP